MSDELKQAMESRERVLAHLKTVMGSKGFVRSNHAIAGLTESLRAEGGINREEFVIALLLAAVSLDTSDDVSVERFGRMMRLVTSVWETVVVTRLEETKAEFAKGGGARA